MTLAESPTGEVTRASGVFGGLGTFSLGAFRGLGTFYSGTFGGLGTFGLGTLGGLGTLSGFSGAGFFDDTNCLTTEPAPSASYFHSKKASIQSGKLGSGGADIGDAFNDSSRHCGFSVHPVMRPFTMVGW